MTAQAAEAASKVCSKCGERKPLEEFDRERKVSDGRRSYCKACRRRRALEQRQELEAGRRDLPYAAKVCKQCGELKPLAEFYRCSNCPDGHQAHCKACSHLRGARRRQDPEAREHDRIHKRLYNQANRERHAKNARYWRVANVERVREYGRQQRARLRTERPEEHRRRGRRATLTSHGMTPEQYDAMLAAQGGVCAACGRPPNGKALAIDHDHAHDPYHRPGQKSCPQCWRGLLHDACNQAVGLLADDPERAEALATYLRRHQATVLALRRGAG